MTKKTTTPVGPTPLLDASGNPTHVASGELIESAWGNAVVDRVVGRFPNLAVLDSFAAATGTLAVTQDYNVVFIRAGATWVPTGIANRVAFRVIGGGAGQSIPDHALTAVTFNSEVSDPFSVVAGGIFTVPARWPGRWLFEWAVEFPPAGAGVRMVFCQAGSATRIGEQAIPIPEPESQTRMSGSASIILSAGEIVHITMYHTGPGAQVCNPGTNQYFQGTFLGSY